MTPRVLVLAPNKIQPYTGGGVILSNLFSGFEEDKVLFLHRDREYGYSTPFSEYRLQRLWVRPDLERLVTALTGLVSEGLRAPSLLRPRDLWDVAAQSGTFRLPRRIRRKVEEFNPQIVYAWASDALWVRTLRALSSEFEVPYVIHFMDNHVGVNSGSPVQLAKRELYRDALDSVARQATAIFTISESMGQTYKQLWDRPYEVFRGLIDTSRWPWPNPRTRAPDDGIFRVGFTGSVERSQLLGLQTVAEAFELINSEAPSVRLVLYLTDMYRQRVRPILGQYRCVEFRTHPDFSDLRSELASVDALVLAYGMDRQTLDYYRYSFATKIVPYMLSGRPIIVHGPAEIEPIAYALRGGWAVEITDLSGTDLRGDIVDAVTGLMNNPQRQRRLARSAWEAGVREHDLEENSRRFVESLSEKAVKR